MNTLRRLLFAFLLTLLPSAAFAQTRTQLTPLNVTGTSANMAFQVGAGPYALAFNDGSRLLFYRLGTSSSVVATSNDIPVPAGCGIPIDIGTNTYIAAISQAGTTTLRITQGPSVIDPFCYSLTTYDSGPVSGSVTAAASSHAVGTALGGLISVPLARIAGGGGGITKFSVKSLGGITNPLVARVWDRQPTGTTCTDAAGFAANDTDDQRLVTPPFTVTPAAPATTVGDSATYFTLDGFYWSYLTATTSNVYVCLINAGSTFTPPGLTLRVTLAGPQN